MDGEIIARARARAGRMLEDAGIVLTPREKENMEIADFGLNDLDKCGLQIVTYVNTERCCAKELVLFPGQTCPEHIHPMLDGKPGKEETFRCRRGLVYLYVEGVPTPGRACTPPEGVYTTFHEVALRPGEQYTLAPGTAHWFQAGAEGCIVSEFSTHSVDERDVFHDARIVR